MINEIMRLIVEKAHERYVQLIPDTLCESEKAIFTGEKIVESLVKGDAQRAAKHMQAYLNLVSAELKCVAPEVKKSKGRVGLASGRQYERIHV